MIGKNVINPALTSLLYTKMKIPPLPPRLVQRAQLIEFLEQGIQDYKLILLAAPAGYGKTTLLVQWAHTNRNLVAWLSISKEDDEPGRFLRYLLAAWDQVQPGISKSPLGILLSSQSPDREAVLSAFVNTASQISEPLVFVLDDYHLIEDHAIHQTLTFLIEHLPPMLHFVLASRGDPPLQIARYRAHQEVLELRTPDLRFLPEETREFFTESMGLSLNRAEIDPLQRQTEGWIAGLQLVALSLRQHRSGAQMPTIHGRHRFVTDYLREDVFIHLPDDTQRFLLQTSLLERLCGSLVEAVTGTGNGQEQLEALERMALFLAPLDDQREWYRYHPLFADFLQEELKRRDPDAVPELHQLAAQWYLTQDLSEQAFQHAVESQSAELVINIIEHYFISKLMADDVRVVRGWLDALPVEWHEQYPIIGMAQAGILMVTGQFDACARRLDQVEQLALTDSDHPGLHRGRVIAMRCNIACFQNNLQRAQDLADQALQFLSIDDLDFRAGIYGSLGDTYRRHGLWQEAKDSYLKLLDFTNTPGFHIQAVHIYGALADLELRQGHLQKAAGYWDKALAALRPRENWGHVPLPLSGWVYIRMGEILYEWNELERAWEHLSSGLERAELGGDVRSLIAGYLLASRLKLTAGELDEAVDYLERARPQVENSQFPHWTSRFERLQMELWLAQDRLRAAFEWLDRLSLDGQLENEMAQLTMARVMIVKGEHKSLDRALEVLGSLSVGAEKAGMTGITIEALALQSLAYSRRGDMAKAMSSLERALRFAEPEGYARLFADLGLPMGRLLQEAHSRDVMPGYIEILLAAFNGELSSSVPAAQALPEPLTEREVQVLELLAAGLTNREIADELVISSETVKKHASNIYGKLGVNNRTEAASRARKLGWLS
jgi:LuxR family maltose regulon positive regulatory protein